MQRPRRRARQKEDSHVASKRKYLSPRPQTLTTWKFAVLSLLTVARLSLQRLMMFPSAACTA